MARRRNGGNGTNKMAYGAGAPATPDNEQQETPRRIDDGKGLNYASFSDAGSSFDIFSPHAPAHNPAGNYEAPGGAGRDNTREIASKARRTARSGRGARG